MKEELQKSLEECMAEIFMPPTNLIFCPDCDDWVWGKPGFVGRKDQYGNYTFSNVHLACAICGLEKMFSSWDVKASSGTICIWDEQ